MIRPPIQLVPAGFDDAVALAARLSTYQIPPVTFAKEPAEQEAPSGSKRQARLSICAECPNIRKAENALFDRCGVCGCILRALTFIPGRCPIQKW